MQRYRQGSKVLAFVCSLILVLWPISGCGGKNIGQMLDDEEGKVDSMMGQAGSTAGLTELQLLETLKMKIEELRVEWKSILGENLDTLNLEQKKMLDNLSQATGKIDALIDRGVSFEDLAVLDFNTELSKFGFPPTNEIRRIVPSAQVYKTAGIYSYVVTLPLFGTGNKITAIKLGGNDITAYKQEVPPHGFRLDIPANDMENFKFFNDWSLGKTELTIIEEGPKKWWQLWGKGEEKTVSVHTGFFPRYPLRYWFAQHPKSTRIDEDPAHLQSVNAPPTMVPGCGTSGCYLSYNICAIAPVNSEPIGDIFNKQDSFSGWGDFVGSPRVSANSICMTYTQHSHNQNRSVWFSTHYKPTMDVQETHYYTLQPLTVGENDKPTSDPAALAAAGIVNDALRTIQAQIRQTIATSDSKMVFVGPFGIGGSMSSSNSSVGNPPPGGAPDPIANPTYYEPNKDLGPTARPLAFGITGFVPFVSGTNWELVVQSFTDDKPVVLSPTKTSSKITTVTEESGRLRVDTTPPY